MTEMEEEAPNIHITLVLVYRVSGNSLSVISGDVQYVFGSLPSCGKTDERGKMKKQTFVVGSLST